MGKGLPGLSGTSGTKRRRAQKGVGHIKISQKPEQQSLKRCMASGPHCPIGIHEIISCHDGAAAPVGTNMPWYHRQGNPESTFIPFSVSGGPFDGSGAGAGAKWLTERS